MKNDCLFCKIINKEVSSDILDESDSALAFRDINPQAPIHILVIPKKHISSTVDIDSENGHYFLGMVMLAKKIAKDENILSDGYRWVINTGKYGGQTVDHIHLHLLSGRLMSWPPG